MLDPARNQALAVPALNERARAWWDSAGTRAGRRDFLAIALREIASRQTCGYFKMRMRLKGQNSKNACPVNEAFWPARAPEANVPPVCEKPQM